MAEPLIAPRMLFRVAQPLYRHEPLWNAKGVKLDEQHCLLPLAELDGANVFADVRAAWSDAGLVFTVRVQGKRQQPWCRASRIEDSDGLHVWIDTRDTHNVHRATRFCHGFAFLPGGNGPKRDQPIAAHLGVARAKEDPAPVAAGALHVRSEKRIDGYVLQALITKEALTGFDPDEHSRLGFNYDVFDRELGQQTWSAGDEFPFDSDPSLWGTLELVT